MYTLFAPCHLLCSSSFCQLLETHHEPVIIRLPLAGMRSTRTVRVRDTGTARGLISKSGQVSARRGTPVLAYDAGGVAGVDVANPALRGYS